MTELSLLRVLLLLSMAVAPLGTHRFFFAEPSRLRTAVHAGALVCAAIGLFLPAPMLCVAWLFFCVASFGQFLRHRAASLRSLPVLAACVPFLFSIIAATWLVGGANDLRILGYGPQFSYYAALHGNVLGWIMIGALAALANQDGPYRSVYLASVFACFASFLLIALGIDQLRMLKPIGVVVLSVAIPASQLAFLRSVWSRNKAAFALGCISFSGLVFTMLLAWRNELSMAAFPAVLQLRGMVSVHGVLNAVVVGPSFLLAVALEARRRANSETSSVGVGFGAAAAHHRRSIRTPGS
ncbi:YndJ family transporter [bacterium AH-315-N03]|nr:YndJ family transporter [bacterium AH-315-N03]